MPLHLLVLDRTAHFSCRTLVLPHQLQTVCLFFQQLLAFLLTDSCLDVVHRYFSVLEVAELFLGTESLFIISELSVDILRRNFYVFFNCLSG